MTPRPPSPKVTLLRSGFVDAERGVTELARLGEHGPGLLPLLAATADPDQALSMLAELADRCAEGSGDPDGGRRLLEAVADEEGTAMRLFAVLGASAALGDHLLRHPQHWEELRDPDLGGTRPAAYAVRAALRGEG